MYRPSGRRHVMRHVGETSRKRAWKSAGGAKQSTKASVSSSAIQSVVSSQSELLTAVWLSELAQRPEHECTRLLCWANVQSENQV